MLLVLLKSEKTLNFGDDAPDFSLMGTDDYVHTFESVKGKKGTLVLFMCNHCPYVISKFPMLKKLAEKGAELGISIVGINSNDPEEVLDDDFAHMKALMKKEEFGMHYLFDETQEIAKLYGAVCTPDPFLFDAKGKLVYHGRLDNALSPSDTATEFDMEDAFNALAEGKPINSEFKPSQGCSIKWK